MFRDWFGLSNETSTWLGTIPGTTSGVACRRAVKLLPYKCQALMQWHVFDAEVCCWHLVMCCKGLLFPVSMWEVLWVLASLI